MHVIVVAKKSDAVAARQLTHMISLQHGCTSSFWSTSRYRERENSVELGKAVVFIGRNELTETFAPLLPVRFSEFGTQCSVQGNKAVLSMVERTGFEGAPKDACIQAMQRYLTDNPPAVNAVAPGFAAMGSVLMPFPFDPIHWLYKTAMSFTKGEREYRKLQGQYLARRFIVEEFPDFYKCVQAQAADT